MPLPSLTPYQKHITIVTKIKKQNKNRIQSNLLKNKNMETLKFKTNIKCGGCIANVTPVLNHFNEIENWKVDTQNPNKILEIEGENLNADKVITALKKAGYQAEII